MKTFNYVEIEDEETYMRLVEYLKQDDRVAMSVSHRNQFFCKNNMYLVLMRDHDFTDRFGLIEIESIGTPAGTRMYYWSNWEDSVDLNEEAADIVHDRGGITINYCFR